LDPPEEPTEAVSEPDTTNDTVSSDTPPQAETLDPPEEPTEAVSEPDAEEVSLSPSPSLLVAQAFESDVETDSTPKRDIDLEKIEQEEAAESESIIEKELAASESAMEKEKAASQTKLESPTFPEEDTESLDAFIEKVEAETITSDMEE
ncbi:MAG: hypothetical protein F6K03_08670, partial [Kamptonema sp. SIO4C4]|nr:hypothetical protein [Kamptonema sp. SIO4C4]